MNKREQVFVVLMVVAAGYGAVYCLRQRFIKVASQASPSATREHAMMFVEESRLRIAAAVQNGDVEYVSRRVLDVWPNNPYAGVVVCTDVATVEDVDVRYSGYFDLGGVVYALLNGRAYTLGDRLPEMPYCVLSISQEQVVLSSEEGDENMVIEVEDN